MYNRPRRHVGQFHFAVVFLHCAIAIKNDTFDWLNDRTNLNSIALAARKNNSVQTVLRIFYVPLNVDITFS